MYHYHLMSDEIPPQEIRGHAPYVTEDEALIAAEKEAVARGETVQVFRVIDAQFESQPWRIVRPPPSDGDRWHFEASIASNEATQPGALKEIAEKLRSTLKRFDVRVNASEDVLIVRVTVVAASEEEASAKAFDAVDAALDDAGPWTERRWASTQVWGAS